MEKEDIISVRVTLEEKAMVERMVEYRFLNLPQGLMKKATSSDYLRYLMNKDLAEARAEIAQRRS